MSLLTSRSAVNLAALLPSTPYVLSYSLPLLLLSILLTFAGTFLTLDRTHSFAPQYDSLPGGHDSRTKKKIHWILEGGIGGLFCGFLFGLHFSTFLALLIPNTSSSAPLSPSSFLPVWVLPAVTMTLLGGRWKYCALAFAGCSGGAALSLSLAVMLHPSLSSRVILTAVVVPIQTIMTALPLARTQHIAMRISTGSTGAFGVVVSIALLARVPSWSNVWERLWVPTSLGWGNSKEKGLTAAWCFLLCAGIACDWFLRRKFGENLDEVWDHYLANYSANLPNAADRAGVFQPFSDSFWGRLFGRKKPSTPMVDPIRWPDDKDLTPRLNSHPLEHGYFMETPTQASMDTFKNVKHPESLKSNGSHTRTRLKVHPSSGRRREGVKFKPLNGPDDGSSSDSEDEAKDTLTPTSARPLSKVQTPLTSASGSSALAESHRDRAMGSGSKIVGGSRRSKMVHAKAGQDEREDGSDGEIPEYSDYEEEATTTKRRKISVEQNSPQWRPEFLRRQHQSRDVTSGTAPEAATSPGAVPVTATPSLIRAVGRITAAQQEAFSKAEDQAGPASSRPEIPTNEGAKPQEQGNHEKKARAARWQEFWREVKEKAK